MVLVVGYKHYSPYNCVLVPKMLNLFLQDGEAVRSKYLFGVSNDFRDNVQNRYQAKCANPYLVLGIASSFPQR